MEKLVLFALALMAIAFSAGSAYNINGHGGCPWCPDCLSNNYHGCILDNPQEQLSHCKMHLITQMVGRPLIQQHLEQCCSQLKQVNEQCQCDAIQQVFNVAVQPQGGVAVAQMLRKAKRLPNDCVLEVQKCSLVSPTDV